MPKVIIPSSIRKHTDNRREVMVGGDNFKESMNELLERYPGLEAVMDNGGLLSLFINNKLVRTGMDNWGGIELDQDDEISLIIPIAGG